MTVASLPLVVMDSQGGRFTLTRELGTGGQGAVYAVEGGRYAVKLLRARSEGERDRLQRKLAAVRRQPLQDLRLARPLAVLAPPLVGYVMELVGDADPLSTLMALPHGGDVTEWYTATGGLQRRYRVLGSMVETIADLHAAGLMYVDLSPANVLFERPENEKPVDAWLIDADNIRAESVAGDTVYTRFWAAPELVAGTRAASSLTDAWAAAVISFRALSLAHPLIGDVVSDGPPDFEDEALSGHFPWIDHPEDATNRCSSGLPRHLLFTQRLQEIFQQMFGGGLNQPSARPGVNELLRELGRAERMLTNCDSCAEAFLFTRARTCPFCGRAQGERVLVRVVFREKSTGPQGSWGQHMLEDRIVLGPARPFVVPADLVAWKAKRSGNDPIAELLFDGDEVTVTLLADVEIAIEGSGRPSGRRTGDRLHAPLRSGKQPVIRFGSLAEPHRILTLGIV